MGCLDTSVLLDIAGRSGARTKRAAYRCLQRLTPAGRGLATTRFTVAELWVGVKRSKNPKREEGLIERLVADLEILEFDEMAARVYGRITATLQEIGRPAGDMDVLIASVAMVHHRVLITRNAKHFADIPGLDVNSY